MKMRINKGSVLLLTMNLIKNASKREYFIRISKSYTSKPTIMRWNNLKTVIFSSISWSVDMLGKFYKFVQKNTEKKDYSNSFVMSASTPIKNYFKKDCGCDPRLLELLRESEAAMSHNKKLSPKDAVETGTVPTNSELSPKDAVETETVPTNSELSPKDAVETETVPTNSELSPNDLTDTVVNSPGFSNSDFYTDFITQMCSSSKIILKNPVDQLLCKMHLKAAKLQKSSGTSDLKKSNNNNTEAAQKDSSNVSQNNTEVISKDVTDTASSNAEVISKDLTNVIPNDVKESSYSSDIADSIINNESLILNEYLAISLYLLFAIFLSGIIISFSYGLALQNPEVEKMSAYECGFEPYEDARQKFDVKFYIFAMLFIVFDMETIFLIPWSVTLGLTNYVGYWVMIDFIFELSVSLFYVWYIGGLEWD